MDILYLLIPLSVVLVLLILVGLWWAIDRGNSTTSNRKANAFFGTIDAGQTAPGPPRQNL